MMRVLLLLLTAVLAFPQSPDAARSRLYRALQSNRSLDPDRTLVHFSHTCSLRLAGKSYPVIEIRELVKGASTPRGVNRIIVLSPSFKPVHQLDYTNERPLFCAENRLYLWTDLRTDQGEGNILEFSPGGKLTKLTHIEPNDLPRKSPPQ